MAKKTDFLGWKWIFEVFRAAMLPGFDATDGRIDGQDTLGHLLLWRTPVQ